MNLHTHSTPATHGNWDSLDTEARIAAIRTHVAMGHGSPVMANQLGTSRSSITGFCRRQNIQLPPPPRGVVELPTVPLPPTQTWAMHRRPVTVMALREHHCRWPVGNSGPGDQMYCGDRKRRGSYCAKHAAMAYAPTKAPLGYDAKKMDYAGAVEPRVTAEEAISVVRPDEKRKGGVE
jgi:GcrA cell cycle regulator